jgi:hypothetical protein
VHPVGGRRLLLPAERSRSRTKRNGERAVRTSENVTLHFDLGHCPDDAEFTLVAGGGIEHKLTSYADAPEKLEEHRAANPALALIPEEHIGRITHFVEDAEIAADHATIRKVVYPSLDDHPLPEIALMFVHVPTGHRRAHIKRNPVTNGEGPHHELLAHYGVEANSLNGEHDHDELRLAADNIKPPRETAKSMVFFHPEIGSTNATVAPDVLDNYITQAEGFQDLVSYIQNNPPGSDDPWYQKAYATWVNPDTGKEEPVPANPDLKYKDDKKPDWPVVDGTPQIPQYDLTDSETSTKDGGVLGAATRVVQNVLVATKDAEQFAGQLWSSQVGQTERVQTNVAPAPEVVDEHPNTVAAAPPGIAADDTDAAKGFALKNITSSYGLWLYDETLAFDSGKKQLSFQVKNWPSRYLTAYVQFLKSTGEPILRKDIPGWEDRMPELLRSAFEPSDSKNYLQLLGAGSAVFGVPVPFLTQRADMEFIWPDDASSAHVLLGGLGVAEGFTDWDKDVDVGGLVGTCLVCYGWGALSLVLTVYVVNPLMVKLGKNKDLETAVYIVGGLVGAVAAAVAAPNYGTAGGKWVLTKLAQKVAGIVFGVVVKKIVMAAAREAIEDVIAASVVEITAAEAVNEVPFAGWALKVASVAADIAALAATTIECLASPATYDLQIQRTMDLTVTVEPDPAHGKEGVDPNWPLVADHWIVQVKYPKGAGGQGGTTYTKAGPMPGPPHNQPLVIPFPGIPAGGKIEVVAGVYSENDWLAGQWDSGWINAVPDSNDQIAAGGNIKENLVPLTPSTTYSQKQRVVYSDAQKHHWQVTRFAIGEDLIGTLDAGKVDDSLREAFAGQGSELSKDASVKPITQGQKWKLTDTGAGVEYELDKVKVYSGDDSTHYEVQVQNLTYRAPTLPDVIHDCADDGHRMCELQNLTYNDKEYMVGYAWRASGQNMPRDYGTNPDNGQMYAFQAISALGQPEDSIIQPSRGFSNPSFIAFDQFGLAPVFAITDATKAGNVAHYKDELNAGGKVPDDLAKEIAAFGIKLPGDAAVNVAAKDARWTIGSPSANPVLDLRLVKEVVDTGKGPELQNVINVFAWPVPSQDNFFLDSRSYTEKNRQYFIRGVSFSPGASTFDYDSKKSWGQFQDVTINDLAVHPQGYVVGVDYDNHKLLTLKLGAEPVDDDKAPIAMPLSGEGLREGLLNKPVALTITSDGRILVLEEITQRIQAFDVLGNPVPCFSVGQTAFKLDKSLLSALDSRDATTALVQAFQKNVMPGMAPLFIESDDDGAEGSVEALDEGTVDKALTDAFVKSGYAHADTGGNPPSFSVETTTAGSLWLVTDKGSTATFDVRYIENDLGILEIAVFRSFAFAIEIKSAGRDWVLTDTANQMTFGVSNKSTGGDPDLQAIRLLAIMPLRTAGQQGVNHLDVAVEGTGYIYTLYTKAGTNGGSPEYMLDVYAPDWSPLFDQSGVYAAKLTVDQWRSMFTLNYEKILGPGQRTEPSVSQWEPSTPQGDGPKG